MSFSSSLHVHNLLSALSPWRLISQFPSTVVAIQENLNTGFNLTHFKATKSSKAPTVVGVQENLNTNLTRSKATRSFKNSKVSIVVAVLESTNWVQGSHQLQNSKLYHSSWKLVRCDFQPSLVENKWWFGIALEWSDPGGGNWGIIKLSGSLPGSAGEGAITVMNHCHGTLDLGSSSPQGPTTSPPNHIYEPTDRGPQRQRGMKGMRESSQLEFVLGIVRMNVD